MSPAAEAESLLGAALGDGRVVAAIALLLLIEVAWLASRAWLGRAARRDALGAIASALAGAFLLLAMREALVQERSAMVGAWLLAALAAHVVDLRLRLASASGGRRDTPTAQ
jgi:hypothetical protein